MDNILGYLREFLLNQLALNTEVSGRIFIGPLPQDEAEFMPRKCLVAIPDGGDTPIDIPYTERRIQFRCYGASLRQADEVYRKLYPNLNRKSSYALTSGMSGTAYTAFEETPGVTLIEPETLWPVEICYYRIKFYDGWSE